METLLLLARLLDQAVAPLASPAVLQAATSHSSTLLTVLTLLDGEGSKLVAK